MKSVVEQRAALLGMPPGTAAARLRKFILFDLVKRLGENICYQCSEPIETCDDLSIEHKQAWASAENPARAFFDLENIAFSHHSCNCRAAFRKKTYPSAKERKKARDKRRYESRMVRRDKWRQRQRDLGLPYT